MPQSFRPSLRHTRPWQAVRTMEDKSPRCPPSKAMAVYNLPFLRGACVAPNRFCHFCFRARRYQITEGKAETPSFPPTPHSYQRTFAHSLGTLIALFPRLTKIATKKYAAAGIAPAKQQNAPRQLTITMNSMPFLSTLIFLGPPDCDLNHISFKVLQLRTGKIINLNLDHSRILMSHR